MTQEENFRTGGPRASASCPHCYGKLKIRSSTAETALSKRMIFVCQDSSCGATFGANLEITHQISPSARPNATVHLRQSPPRRRAANDEHPPKVGTSGPEVPPAANENGALGEAAG